MNVTPLDLHNQQFRTVMRGFDKDEVLAFCSARPQDGGTGAVYVLLRKS